MTSTEFTAGLNEGSRISSKVLKPPGGGSSDIFGQGNANKISYRRNSEKNQANEDSNTHNRVFGVCNSTPTKPVLEPQTNTVENENQPIPKQTKRVYVRRNPITGEEIEICLDGENNDNTDNKDVKEEEITQPSFKPAQTSIRVRNPPGGKSSGIF